MSDFDDQLQQLESMLTRELGNSRDRVRGKARSADPRKEHRGEFARADGRETRDSVAPIAPSPVPVDNTATALRAESMRARALEFSQAVEGELLRDQRRDQSDEEPAAIILPRESERGGGVDPPQAAPARAGESGPAGRLAAGTAWSAIIAAPPAPTASAAIVPARRWLPPR